VADDLGRGNAGGGLRNLDMAGERVDDVAGQVGAIGRGERRALFAPEIIVNDEVVPVMGQHEVETRALELTVKDQVRIGNNDGTIRQVAVRLRREGLGVKGLGDERIDMDIGGRVGTLAVQGNRGVKFASVIQPGAP